MKRTVLSILLSAVLVAAMSFCVSAKLMYSDCNAPDGFWGNPNPTLVSGGQEGSYLEAGLQGGDIVICFAPQVDVAEYVGGGYFHMWLYISDIDAVGYGQVELTSAGSPDYNEVCWSFGTYGDLELKTGWNELTLSFADGMTASSWTEERGGGMMLGEPDYAAINYFRIYCNLVAPCTIGIDDMYFDNPAAATEAPATEAPATEAPATEAPATAAPVTETPASDGASPSTGDVLAGAAVLSALVSAALAVAVRRGKKKA